VTLAWFDDETRFAAELARGRRGELRVAMKLLPLGLWIRIGPAQWRDGTHSWEERREQFADEVDLELEGGHLLEVKARNLTFTCAEDYPYSTVWVGATKRWRARTRMPCGVVILSEPTDAVIIVPTSTREYWTVESGFDSVRGFMEQAYAIARERAVNEDRLLAHLRAPCRGA